MNRSMGSQRAGHDGATFTFTFSSLIRLCRDTVVAHGLSRSLCGVWTELPLGI